MKYKNTNKTKSMGRKKIIILIIIGLIFISACSAIAYKIFFNTTSTSTATPENNGSYTPPSEEEVKQQAAVDAAKKDELAKSPEKPVSVSPSVQSIEIKAQKESNGTVTIFTKLFNYSAGTCMLSVTKGSNSLSQTAEIIYQREYSSCAGFSVPIKELGEGTWSIKLKTTSSLGELNKNLDFEVK